MQLRISKNGNYEVLVRRKNIPLHRLSIGERNIISLCYFFSKINEQKNTNQIYKNPKLVIVDDPISSFDAQNKIGVLSFFKTKVFKVIERKFGK